MIKNPDNEKLFNAVKDALEDYHPSHSQPDWNTMSRMLDNTPATAAGKSWSSMLNLLVGAAVLAGGYLLYDHFASAKASDANKAVEQTAKYSARPEGYQLPSYEPKQESSKTTPVETASASTNVQPENPVSQSTDAAQTQNLSGNGNPVVNPVKENIKEEVDASKILNGLKNSNAKPIYPDQVTAKGITDKTKESKEQQQKVISLTDFIGSDSTHQANVKEIDTATKLSSPPGSSRDMLPTGNKKPDSSGSDQEKKRNKKKKKAPTISESPKGGNPD